MVCKPDSLVNARRSFSWNWAAVSGGKISTSVLPYNSVASIFRNTLQGGVVGEHVAAVQIFAPRQAGQVLHEAAEAAFAFLDGQRGLFLLADVANVAGEDRRAFAGEPGDA